MTAAPTLALDIVAVDRPLPALWDGRAVTWDPFTVEPRMFICDRSKRKHGLIVPSCDACGTPGPRLVSTGLRAPQRNATEPGEYLRVHRNGQPVFAMEPARPLRDLHASRCRACGHDQVLDIGTGDLWDLDETDYGPEGSDAP